MNTDVAMVTSRATPFRKASARETAVLLIVAALVPFVVHWVPWSGTRPLGAHLLPMFWATFVAAYFFGAPLAALVGLFAPAVNLVVTGLPAWRFLSVMSAELVVFAVLSAWAVSRMPRSVVTAPLVFVAVCLGSTMVRALAGLFGEVNSWGSLLMRPLVGGLVGMALLCAINLALVRFYPKSAASAAGE